MQASFHVRDLCQMPNEMLISLLPEDDFHQVQFDDGGVIEATPNETVYSHLFWKLLNNYPTTPIAPKHHIVSVLKGLPLTTDSHRRLLTNILKSIVTHNALWLPEQKEMILKDIYQSISDAQRFLMISTEADVISLDVLDFVSIAHYPPVLAYVDEAKADPGKIKYAYEGIIKIIKTDPKFTNNNLAKAVRANMVKMNQVVQCIAFRGFPTEVDGTIYPEPIWSNYTDGNRKFYDFIADSRTAAKSHFYSDSALKDSEYRARKFQLYAMVLERIVYEDCGSDRLIAWPVKGQKYDDAGTVTYSGDLGRLVGKYYCLNKGEPLQIIQGDEDHLIGRTIWIRSVLTCKHPDPHAVCHVCTGELSQNISRFANLGHLGTVTTSGQLTQNILSIKHVNMSSVTLRILLGDHERRYLNTGDSGEGFFINEPKQGEKIELIVLRDEIPGLLDFQNQEYDEAKISHVSLPRISSISSIVLKIWRAVKGGHEVGMVTLKVVMRQQKPMLSRELLSFLTKRGWAVDESNNFIFDMTDWDYKNDPILVLQSKEESFVDLADEVKTMIQSSQKHHKKRLIENAPAILLQELFDVVNSKLNINILSMETIIYGLMVHSDVNYALGRTSDNPVLGLGDALTIHRSLGSAMAFQNHEDALLEPMYHFKGYRPDSLMDIFLKPKEVIEDYYGPQK